MRQLASSMFLGLSLLASHLIALVAGVSNRESVNWAVKYAQVFARRQASPRSKVTQDFEVSNPVTVPSDAKICDTQILMEHTFANSYGVPFVGEYNPPACDFNSVIMNFTVTVSGKQFDRLAMMYLGDVEIWRTSTAEPTPVGVVWSYSKDMSQYLSLWAQPQTIIFELDNVNDSTYTGQYHTTLTIVFFTVDGAPPKADLILPISARNGVNGKQSVFMIPAEDASVRYAIPSNVTRATVSISANGQIDEEFWYTNVFSSEVHTFPSTSATLLGGGPFREVQLLIDGYLAGVVWPFPVIFTGGIAPGLWRPIVGIETFDLSESEIDITPFIPLLTDDQEHNFTINVLQLADDGRDGTSLTTVESYWLATGKIFLFYESSKPEVEKHAAPVIQGIEPAIFVSSYIETFPNGTNVTLSYSTIACRTFSVESPFGSFTQSLSFFNTGKVSSGGFVQTNVQSTKGTQVSVNTRNPGYNQTLNFEYPIRVTSSYDLCGADTIINASMSRGLQWVDTGRPDISMFTRVAGPSMLDTTQTGTGNYSSVTNATYNFGTTHQSFRGTSYGYTYERNVKAVNGTVVLDIVGG